MNAKLRVREPTLSPSRLVDCETSHEHTPNNLACHCQEERANSWIICL